MSSLPQIDAQALASMAPEELRALTAQLLQRIEQDAQRADQASQAIALRDAKIDKLSFELAQLRRIRFGVKSEQLDAQQRPLFEEAVQADIAALEEELAELKAAPQAAEAPKQIPKRQALPPELPRISIAHEPTATVCTTPRIDSGEEALPAWPGHEQCARVQRSATRLLRDRAKPEVGDRCHRVQCERPQALPVGLQSL